MTEIELDPKEIRFTHSSIFHVFRDGRRLVDTIEDLTHRKIDLASIPLIRVVQHKGHYWTLDNRRLYVFREANIPIINAIVVEEKGFKFHRKLTNKEDGKEIIVLGKDKRSPISIKKPTQ